MINSAETARMAVNNPMGNPVKLKLKGCTLLNLRSSMEMNTKNIICQIKSGETMTVIPCDENTAQSTWVKVAVDKTWDDGKVDRVEGFVMSEYCSQF